jgi:hypothetical protein
LVRHVVAASLIKLLPLASGQAFVATDYFYPPQDANGWTIIPSDPDALRVYVDPSSTAQGTESGTEANPFRTLLPAWQLVHARRLSACSSCPTNAQIYIKRGTTLVLDSGVAAGNALGLPTSITTEAIGGLSPTQPLVITSYGSGTERPKIVLRATANSGIDLGWDPPGNINNPGGTDWLGDIWIVGLEFTSQSFTSSSGQVYWPLRPKQALDFSGGGAARILIEDCYFHHVGGAFKVDNGAPSAPGDKFEGITFRRNVVADTWDRGATAQDSRGGGIYFSQSNYSLIEENYFINAGYTYVGSPLLTGLANPICPKNTFSHAMYLPAANKHMLIRNNVVIRPAFAGIQSRGGQQRVFNNLIIEAPNAIACGHGQNQGTSRPTTFDNDKWWQGECSYNVVLDGANLDQWIQVDLDEDGDDDEVVEIRLNQDVRGRGISVSRCIKETRIPNSDPPEYVSRDYSERNPGETAIRTIKAGTVHHNLIANNYNGGEPSAGGIMSDDDSSGGFMSDLDLYSARIHDNVVYNWKANGGQANGPAAISILNAGLDPTASDETADMSPRFVIENNKFVKIAYGVAGQATEVNAGGTWTSNTYFSNGTLQPNQVTPDNRFRGRLQGTSIGSRTFSQWTNIAPSRGSTASIDLSQVYIPEGLCDFPEPERSMSWYLIANSSWTPPVPNAPETVAHSRFAEQCLLQQKGNWNPIYSAQSFNAYMRTGFAIPQP